MIQELNNLRRCLSRHIRRNELRIHLRWVYENRINYLSTWMNVLRKLSLVLNIRSKRCPTMCKLDCRVDMHVWHHSIRCPRISSEHPSINILDKLIRILNHRLKILRRNLKVKARASVFSFSVIRNYRLGILMRILMVITINYLRIMMGGHALGKSNRVSNSRWHNK